MSYKVIECPYCNNDCGAEAEDQKIMCENPQCPILKFKVFDK